jgi:hypothetical protein
MKTLLTAVSAGAVSLSMGICAADLESTESAQQDSQADIAGFEAHHGPVPSRWERPRPLYEIWSTVLWGGDPKVADVEENGESDSSQ